MDQIYNAYYPMAPIKKNRSLLKMCGCLFFNVKSYWTITSIVYVFIITQFFCQ